VLGGGGVAGIGWELGLLAGLAEAGLDVRLNAGLYVGTSAGATVAAQITSGFPLDALIDKFASPDSAEKPVSYDIAARRKYLAEVEDGARDEIEAAARLGHMACAATTVPETERRAIIASRLPAAEWPDVPLRIVAVNARTGKPIVFDRTSGVPLTDAVAASCAIPGIWPPVSIGRERYIDGGARSHTNADFAVGCSRVLVILPLEPGGRLAAALSAELKGLCTRAKVLLVKMDERGRRAMGSNPLDPSTRHAMVDAGRVQAAEVAEGVARL
jgi:NTE family protein